MAFNTVLLRLSQCDWNLFWSLLRLHKQSIQQNPTTQSSLPGIVVVGLLLDYLTWYYLHQKSLTTNTDEQIGSTLEASSSATMIPPQSVATSSTLFSTGLRSTRERLMFSEATRYRAFTLCPHAVYRWVLPVSSWIELKYRSWHYLLFFYESMAKAGFYYSLLKDNDDRTLYFTCTVTFVCWEPSDSSWIEHGPYSSNCPSI